MKIGRRSKLLDGVLSMNVIYLVDLVEIMSVG
jgi:hypothetical protein